MYYTITRLPMKSFIDTKHYLCYFMDEQIFIHKLKSNTAPLCLNSRRQPKFAELQKGMDIHMPKSQERCQEIREETRARIIHNSMLYFARNGFAGTKISDLAKNIGIGQGTLYLYFKSKEELFHEIFALANNKADIQNLKILNRLPIPAKKKIQKLSERIMDRLTGDEVFAAKIAISVQMMLEQKDFGSAETTYQSELYRLTGNIIRQGQQEGSVIEDCLSSWPIITGAWSIFMPSNGYLLPNTKSSPPRICPGFC